jgi:peptide/nickel transport system substrate-binding protein
MTFPYEVTIPLLKDIKTQSPQAICEVGMASETIGMLVNRTVEPFDNPDLRRAMALTLDRKSFIDILGQGEGEIGGALMPPPDGVWGMPPEMVQTLPGYTGDVPKNRDEARALMQKAGYGPDKRLPIKISTRNLAVYRDPAAILIDQLKEIGIDGELETVETAQWVPKLMRKDFKVGLNVLGTAVDDPDVYFYQNYVCSSARNYMGYCDKEFDKMVDQQSMEADPATQKAGVGYRPQAAGRPGAPRHLPPARRDLLAARGQGTDDDDQQPVQWLALRGCMARQIGGIG